MIESSDWPASKLIKIIIIVGLLSQYSCACGLKISLDCDEGSQAITGNGNDRALNFQDALSLLMSPFISDANAQDDYQTYKNSKIKFESEGTVTGKGFTNVRNRMVDAGNDSLSRSLHGSGSYSSETAESYYSVIASEVPDEIAEEFGDEGDLINGTSDSQFSALKTSNLSAAYYATPFYPFGQTYLKFSSKWSDTTKAKSDQNTVSFLESYRHATKINKSSDLTIHPYDMDSKLEADFQGAADIRYSSPENCFQDSYIGSYDLTQDLSSDQLIHSSTGTGFANIDRKIKENGLQRTYAHGSGDLVLDEQIGPGSNHIEKSVKLIYKPTEFAVNPGNSLNLSSKWSEGVSSQTDDHIRLSESFTDIELMDKETEVTDLTNAETNVNYTGRGEFVIAGENYTSDEVYMGNYSLVRKVEIVQLPRYNKAHVTVTKQLYIDPLNCKIADYSIIVTNDGNSVLGPVFIRDTFPTSTSFQGSSEPPIELTTRIANWSIENLYPGEIKQIRLKLKIEKEVDKLTNRVRATAYYLDKSNKQFQNHLELQLNCLTGQKHMYARKAICSHDSHPG